MQRPSLFPWERNQNNTVRTGVSSPVAKTVKDVPNSFGDLSTSPDYLVIDRSPFDVIIGDPKTDIMPAVLDLGRSLVRLTKKDHAVEL